MFDLSNSCTPLGRTFDVSDGFGNGWFGVYRQLHYSASSGCRPSGAPHDSKPEARRAGARLAQRGVKTSVFASLLRCIGYGHTVRETPFTETDWTDPNGEGIAPYAK